MTAKTDKNAPKQSAREKDEANRQSPDHPVGTVNPREDRDFYQRQRDESPDGMTPAERDAHQKAAPGSLGQTAPDGEKLGESEDIANPAGGTEQSGGR